MPKDKEFCDYVVRDLLGELPAITARAMFGGWGIYQRGIIFAIIADGTLYFRVDEKNRRQYEAAGSKPFTYTMPGKKTMTMSYFELPERIMEEGREEVGKWVEKSVAASWSVRRAKSAGKK